MSDPLRYILIGTGGQGAIWCRNVLPRLAQLKKAEPAGAVDINPDRLGNARDYLGLSPEKCFTDPVEAFQTLIADFVIISTPTPTHEKLIDMAITFDMHVLCEGPLTDAIESTALIRRKMWKARKKLAVCTSARFEQDKQTMETFLRDPSFGRLNYLVSRFATNLRVAPTWGRWRHEMSNVLLVEAGTQHFDVLRALAGCLTNSGPAKAKSVFAKGWQPPFGQFMGDSIALVTAEMENGVFVSYEGSAVNAAPLNPLGNEYIRAECDKATLELDRQSIQMMTRGQLDEPMAEPLPLMEQELWGNVWLAELFCDWLRGGAEPPHSVENYIETAGMAFAAVESAHTEKAVDVKAFLDRHKAAAKAEVVGSKISD